MILKPTTKGLKGLRNLLPEEKQVITKVENTPEKKKSEAKKQEKKTEKKVKKERNTLPPDEYKPMFEPIRFLVREYTNSKNQTLKQYIELSIKRFDDEEAKPFVWLQMYQESDFYTGYLKGKTTYLPLENIYDLIENLTAIDEKCEELNILE